MLTWIEFAAVVIVVPLAFSFPRAGARWFDRVERRFKRIAQNRTLSILIVAAVALLSRAAILPILPITDPSVHDDFSFLLAADTFAHGRLANPTHPMWIHFETFHVIWHPTYASMYQPAQGLVLAAGQVIAGHPFWGMWASVALMCAVICWMLQGWMPPEWALLGGLLAVARFGIFSYWANSYSGGAVAATGGALALGALPRLRLQPHIRDALLMGLGIAILANSRPYEGMMLSLAAGALLLTWMLGKNRPPLQDAILNTVIPLGLVLAVTGLAMGYYFWRVTGSPFHFPYQVNRQTYASAPYFLWQSPRPQPTYHHEVMRSFYIDWELPYYQDTRSIVGLFTNALAKLKAFWFFFIGPALMLPVLMALAIAPYGLTWNSLSRDTRYLMILFGFAAISLAAETFFSPHYAAPMTALVLALALQAMRYLRAWAWKGQPVGSFMTRAVVLVCFLVVFSRIAIEMLHLPSPADSPQTCCSTGRGNWYRSEIQNQLSTLGRPQLVLVRYGHDHNVVNEWVYNQANIDGSAVVWARDMGNQQNQELLEYFKDRQVWLVEPDQNPPQLSPYYASTAGAGK